MTARDLYHGSNGDKILSILQSRQMQPDSEGRIYFSEHRVESVFMHGGDLKRKLTFAIKVRVQIPTNATLERTLTPGVTDTLVVRTAVPVVADVLDLYIRRPNATAIELLRGAVNIHRFLVKAA